MLPQSWLAQQPAGVIQNNQSLQVCQQKIRLQSLQMERERLKQRQQEIMRSQVGTWRSLGELISRNSSHCNRLLDDKSRVCLVQQELLLRQSNTDAAMDPFLSGINEQHARQESADSGLGLGTTYSLPHTPEDFLANIDDNMDGTSGKIRFAQECFGMWNFSRNRIPLLHHRKKKRKKEKRKQKCAKKNVVRLFCCQRILNSRFMNNYFARLFRLQKGTVRWLILRNDYTEAINT